MSMILCIAV